MPEPSAVASADPWGERMPRTVGLVDAIAVLVGVTIGSGIFRVPATVAGTRKIPLPMVIPTSTAMPSTSPTVRGKRSPHGSAPATALGSGICDRRRGHVRLVGGWLRPHTVTAAALC